MAKPSKFVIPRLDRGIHTSKFPLTDCGNDRPYRWIWVIGNRDKKDAPFVALALAIENDGIWTNDEDFSVVSGIKVWNTRDILDYLSANR